ncbi:hypothetical protein LSH36_45g08051 [Paralvinella palmiformis]|uniref:Sulfatase N-terminal domain-containing protein n=1 Tax=Paralvinella palmiformis TaxID=53620 RepID=A0AAD9K6J0_9ANNE|nr:hypothetical protein LSH36_45g08051 [Paralvinella palmiformis]
MNNDIMVRIFFVFSGCITLSVVIFVLHLQLTADNDLVRTYTANKVSLSNQRQARCNFVKSFVTEEQAIFDEQITQAVALPANSQRRHVLFIIVDGMRPQLGAYYDPEHPDYFSKIKIQTPNLDKFASQSMVFKHAYVQYSLCGPSRTSLLTSRRPDVTHVYYNHAFWRKVGGNFTTLPQHFKKNGYLTVGLGKVFHVKDLSNYQDIPSWTEPYYHPPHTDRQLHSKDFNESWGIVSELDEEKFTLMDTSTTKMAKTILKNISKEARAEKRYFFMAVGYNKPHMKLICPEKYYNLYPLEDDEHFLVNESWQTPVFNPNKNMEGARIINNETVLSSDVLRRLRRAYFACISYVDDLVGELLQQLVDCGLDGNTIVSFVADHGFHLGENHHWGKNAVWEIANRVPMIIRIPGITDSGMTSSSIVEALDLFPTVVEAAGLDPVPLCPADSSRVELCTQGKSLMPVIRKPDCDIKGVAFSQLMQSNHVLYTIRTASFRLVDRASFVDSNKRDDTHKKSVEWPQNTSYTMLYDHTKDILEQVNVAEDPNYASIVDELREKLHKFVNTQFNIN